MGSQVILDATLIAGPGCVTDSTFPSGTTSFFPLLAPSPKPYEVETKGVPIIASPDSSTFTTIGSIGVEVTQVTTFYARSQSPMTLRMTFKDPGGGPDVVINEPLQGVKLSEYPAGAYLKALSVNGNGKLEFWAAGTS